MGRIIPLIIAVFGAFWAYQGWFEYGIWVNRGPGGGFIPFVIGLLTVLLCIPEIVANKSPVFAIEKKHAIPVIATVIMLAAVKLLGMVITFGLFMAGWLVFLEKYPKLRAAVIGVSTSAVTYFLFKHFLQVPLPTGYLGI